MTPQPVTALVPRVSVVMPVRDGERFLREALDSTLAQTLAEPGADRRRRRLDRRDGPDPLPRPRDRDARVRVQHQQPGGLAVAINAGCALARRR